MSEGNVGIPITVILTHEYTIYCNPWDSLMVVEDVNPVEKLLEGIQPSSYLSSLAIPFSFSLISFNHAWSMHSVHLLPYLNLERSIFVGLSPIVSI